MKTVINAFGLGALGIALLGCSHVHHFSVFPDAGSGDGDGGDVHSGDATDVMNVSDATDVPNAPDGTDGSVNPLPPRLVAPTSAVNTTSQRPLLVWSLASGSDGASVTLCRDRALTDTCQSFSATGTSGRPATALGPGAWFWRASGTSGGAVGSATSATWEFFVGARNAGVDSTVGLVLDVNGDGRADVVVGDPAAMGGIGQVYVYLGGAGGVGASASTTLTGSDANGGFGSSVAAAGDVNGDGFGDLIVGAPNALSFAGKAYLFLGSATSTGVGSVPVATETGATSATFGSALSSAGDVNSDGFADVLIGAPNEASGLGGAHIFFGGASGTGIDATLTPLNLVGTTGSQGNFGSSVAGNCDVDGNRQADILVGAPGNAVRAGNALLYVGTGTSLMPTPIPLSMGGGEYYGRSISCGDVNADGYSDAVVGAKLQASVFLGAPSGLASTPQALTLTSGVDMSYGLIVATADLTGDGFADVVVTEPNSTTHPLMLYPGSVSGVSASTFVAVTTTGEDLSFATVLSVPGDVNADGFADIVVGDPSLGGSGNAVVFFGATGGLGSPHVIANPASAGMFGSALAFLDPRSRRPPAVVEILRASKSERGS